MLHSFGFSDFFFFSYNDGDSSYISLDLPRNQEVGYSSHEVPGAKDSIARASPALVYSLDRESSNPSVSYSDQNEDAVCSVSGEG